jgi:FGGY-family pentulose kinase
MFILGIDGGTEAIKAGLFDLQGKLIAWAAKPYQTSFPHPGWAEQDPLEWWQCLTHAVHDCLKQAAISKEDIKAVCAGATTCTLLPIKKNGALLGPALLWMDVRASKQAERIFQTKHPALCYSLAGASAEWMPSKVLWLKEHQPDIYKQADYFIEYVDYLAYKLTGRFTLNLDTITQRWFYKQGWPIDFFATIGLEDLAEKFPQDILPIGDVVGPLSKLAAETLGLPEGIPVVTGGGDAFIGLLGLGVTEPGDLGLVMGSSNALSVLSQKEIHVPGIFGSFPDAVIPGLHLLEGGQVSTGSILSWFKRNLALDLNEEAIVKKVSVYQLLDEQAKTIPLGSEGLIVLDYFQGNRTPHTDALARGVVLGLSLQTSRAHLFRAVMEGIAYGLKDILDTFAKHDCNISRIIACGGATQSPFFMQIYADVTGQPLYTTKITEASLLGPAVAAAYGAGFYSSLSEASSHMVHIDKIYQPDLENHQSYQFYVQQYKDLYKHLHPMMKAITHHVKEDL